MPGAVAGEPRVDAVMRRDVPPVHEEAVDQAQEVVAGGAGHRPASSGSCSPGPRIFSADDVERPRLRRGRLGRGAGAVERGERLGLGGPSSGTRRRAVGDQSALLQPPEVLAGRVEAVRVVDAQAGDLALADQPQDELVGRVEDRRAPPCGSRPAR